MVGGLLMLGLFGSAIAIGLIAWRRSSGVESERVAALWAVAVAFAVSATFDWFWELPGLGAVFFLAAGALLSTAPSSSPPRTRRSAYATRAAATG